MLQPYNHEKQGCKETNSNEERASLLWNIYKQKFRLGLQIPAESYIKPHTQATQRAHV